MKLHLSQKYEGFPLDFGSCQIAVIQYTVDLYKCIYDRGTPSSILPTVICSIYFAVLVSMRSIIPNKSVMPATTKRGACCI